MQLGGVRNGQRGAILFGLLVPATVIMAMDRAILSLSGPVLRAQYGLTLPQLGSLFTGFFWAYAAAQIPAGLLVARIGPRLSLFGAMIVWSVMTVLTPFAPSFFGLLLFRILLGLGQAADWPSTVAAVNDHYDEGGRPAANAAILCALYAGPLLGAPMFVWLVLTVGLRSVFLLCGVLGLGFAVAWLLLYRDGGDRQARTVTTSGDTFRLLRSILQNPRSWLIATSYGSTSFLLAFYLTWLPSYLADARHMDIKAISAASMATSAALCLCVLAAGRALSRSNRGRLSSYRARAWVGTAALLAAGGVSLLMDRVVGDVPAVGLACAAIAALAFAQVVTWSCVQQEDAANTAILAALVSVCGNLAAGATPLVSSRLAASVEGWSYAFFSLAAVGVVGAGLWVAIALQSGHARAEQPRRG